MKGVRFVAGYEPLNVSDATVLLGRIEPSDLCYGRIKSIGNKLFTEFAPRRVNATTATNIDKGELVDVLSDVERQRR